MISIVGQLTESVSDYECRAKPYWFLLSTLQISSETILVSAVYITNVERNHIGFCCLHYECRAKPYWFLLSTLRMSRETILVSAVYITNVDHIGFYCLHYECRPYWLLLSTLRIGFYCLDYECPAKPCWFLLTDNSIRVCYIAKLPSQQHRATSICFKISRIDIKQ